MAFKHVQKGLIKIQFVFVKFDEVEMLQLLFF